MRLIDKDALLDTLHMFYDCMMRGPGEVDYKAMYKQILQDIENEPEMMKVRNMKTYEIEVYSEDDVFDQEEIIPNCTVQIWSNSKTGNVSIGWWRNE